MKNTFANTPRSQGVVRRREVLIGAALAPAFAFSHGLSNAAASGAASGVLGAIFDPRFLQSLAFAERAKSLGIRPFGFAGDTSSLWFDQLLPVLQARLTPLVGLTSTGALFCFEQLAWDAGMRVRFRVDHREEGNAVRHFESAEIPAVLRAPLIDAGRAFGGRAADMALGCKAAWGDCTHSVVPRSGVLGATALVTWVIAPLNSQESTGVGT